MPRTKVGIREFREQLASILESKTPVTVTRHGETVGVFVPVQSGPATVTLVRSRKPTKADIEAIGRAGAKMDAIIAAKGTTAEELIADFEAARREKRASRLPNRLAQTLC
jgi:antitoxin (DNA-binding transcriptional repressor) of toxin-antitoxin stability system